jgi:hypothetical protein
MRIPRVSVSYGTVDKRADELLERVDRGEVQSDDAFDRALDKHDADLREIEDFVGQVDNGGPTSGGGSGS